MMKFFCENSWFLKAVSQKAPSYMYKYQYYFANMSYEKNINHCWTLSSKHFFLFLGYRVRLKSWKFTVAFSAHSPVQKTKDFFKRWFTAWSLVYSWSLIFCRKFFIDASTVDAAEQQFNIDEYSDITMVTKPVVYMTVQEIIDTHQVEMNSSHGILFLSLLNLPYYPKAMQSVIRNQLTRFSPVLHFI